MNKQMINSKNINLFSKHISIWNSVGDIVNEVSPQEAIQIIDSGKAYMLSSQDIVLI